MAGVLISGASGLIGSALSRSLRQRGDQVIALIRRTPHSDNEREWHPEAAIAPEVVSGFETVIHLSGENVSGRWTKAKKRRIRDSRVITTHNLSCALAAAEKKPTVFLCASAIGYYGSRGDELLTEESPSGQGFFPDSCREWEAATEEACAAGIRVGNLRTGIVLSRDGGALKQMLLPFRLGVGGRIGSGRQWWSWIHIEDFVAAVLHVLSCVPLGGPVNMTAPNPATNMEFTRELAHALHCPALLPVPESVVRLAFGELADEGLLASTRVVPQKLLASEFQFKFPELGAALADLVR